MPFHLSELVFEFEAGVREGADDVRSVICDKNPDVDVSTVGDDAALPEPACRGRGKRVSNSAPVTACCHGNRMLHSLPRQVPLLSQNGTLMRVSVRAAR